VGTEASAWDETYWRAFAEASPDIVLVVDPSGTILYSNRVVVSFAGGPVVGRKIWEFATGDGVARLTGKLREVVASRKAVFYENEGMRGDGSLAWYEARAIPVVVDGEVERILWVSTDVSARKRLEEQVRQAQKMEAIGLFAGGVAHDFANILAVILASAEFAAREPSSSGPLAPVLGEITDAARRGGELTRRLLALSRTRILSPRPVELGAVVADFGRMMRRILGKDIELIVLDPEAQVTVDADSVQLDQVLLNLCTNARQAMPRGGALTLATRRVDLDARFVRENAARSPWVCAGSFAEISVRDTGAGMDAATLARAFDLFFTTKSEGTGLGLATVHGIVRQHGGFVLVDSAPGAGTTFRVYLPRVPDDELAREAPTVTSP
jgi:PAS domain S-box-containing protein